MLNKDFTSAFDAVAETMMMIFKRLPVALLMLCLLITLYIGVINIEVQGFEYSSPTNRTKTKWLKKYDDGNRRQIEEDEVNC